MKADAPCRTAAAGSPVPPANCWPAMPAGDSPVAPPGRGAYASDAFGSTPPQIYLQPGELVIVRSPTIVSTVLGSCVAITCYDRATGRAGICHAMLPSGAATGQREIAAETRWRYVDAAVAELRRQFASAGGGGRGPEVKLFGGARLLGARSGGDDSVGAANVALARQLLAAAGWPVCASDTGGTVGRKVFFDTRCGVVHLRRFELYPAAA